MKIAYYLLCVLIFYGIYAIIALQDAKGEIDDLSAKILVLVIYALFLYISIRMLRTKMITIYRKFDTVEL